MEETEEARPNARLSHPSFLTPSKNGLASSPHVNGGSSEQRSSEGSSETRHEANSSAQLLDEANGEKVVPKKTAADNDYQRQTTWRRALSNTWLFELAALSFSVLSLIAIAVILRLYDGKSKPHLQFGLTLNAIISILATASKSALLCAVGGAIGQLKWCWFNKERKLLAIQRFDDASRGPLGSVVLIFGRTGLSLASIGAIIIVLALIFDPFIQQIVAYQSQPSVIPTARDSAQAAITKKASTFAVDYSSLEFVTAIHSGIWADGAQFARAPACSSANCHWPAFKTLEWCSKCSDATASATLKGACDNTFVNGTNCKLSIGNSRSVNVLEWRYYHGPYSAYYFADQIIWALHDPLPVRNYNFSGYSIPVPSNDTTLGVAHPALVLGFASLNMTTGQNSSQKISVTSAEMCVLTPCIREYKLKTVNNALQKKIISTNYGITKEVQVYSTAYYPCWQPDDKNVTYTYSEVDTVCTGQAYGDCQVWRNVSESAFCQPGSYASAIIPHLAGNSSSYSSTYVPPGGGYPTTPGPLWLGGNITTTPIFQITAAKGLSYIVHNVAASLTNLGLDLSNQTVHGHVLEYETIVRVRWEWLIFPAFLELLGLLLLVTTAVYTYRQRTQLWRSSLLPLLYHGLDEATVRDQTTAVDVWGMEENAKKTVVRLAHADDGDRVLLKKTATIDN